jgi:hypothetical protein
MLRVANDPVAVRTIAARLLGLPKQEWSDWEIDFLHNMAEYEGPESLSMRRREILFELRDDAEYITRYRGLSIRILNDRCIERRDELEPADEALIVSLKGKEAIQRRRLGRFLRCCRKLGEIEDYM